MVRSFRYLLCAFGALALLGAATAVILGALDGSQKTPVSAASQPGTACSQSRVSAVNQYCENIPSATGGNQAGPGTPPLASQLPSSASSRVQGAIGPASRGRRHGRARSRKAASPLLGLPAPGIRLPLAATGHGGASGWSLFPGLLIVLAVLALGLSALAVARRRGVQARPEAP